VADLRDLLSDAAEGPVEGFDPQAVRARVRQRAQRRRVAGGLAAFVLAGLTVVGVAAVQGPDQRGDQVVAGDPETTTTTTGPPEVTTTTAATPPATTTTTAVADPPPETTTTTTAPSELEDGRHFGYLVGAEPGAGGRTVLLFDLAQWFEGDDADRAAQEDGVVGPGEEIENDVYIRNDNDRIRRVVVDPQVVVTVVDCESGCDNRPADLPALLARPQPTPVWLGVADGVVAAADEQYLP
jgi:hypothetical protein